MVIATTHNLLVYTLPGAATTSSDAATNNSVKKPKKKVKVSHNGSTEKLSALLLERTAELPSSLGEGSTFRAVRYVLLLKIEPYSYFVLKDIIRKIRKCCIL